MSRNTLHTYDEESVVKDKWQRRDSKRALKMRVHGQRLKKLAKSLTDKKTTK